MEKTEIKQKPKHIPCVVLMDTSKHMLDCNSSADLQSVLKKLAIVFQKFGEKAKYIDVAVLSVADEVSILEVCSADEFEVPEMEFKGDCLLNQGIADSLGVLEDMKSDYQEMEIKYKMPIVFIITAGEAKDNYDKCFAKELLLQAVQKKDAYVYALSPIKDDESEASKAMYQKVQEYFDDFGIGGKVQEVSGKNIASDFKDTENKVRASLAQKRKFSTKLKAFCKVGLKRIIKMGKVFLLVFALLNGFAIWYLDKSIQYEEQGKYEQVLTIYQNLKRFYPFTFLIMEYDVEVARIKFKQGDKNLELAKKELNENCNIKQFKETIKKAAQNIIECHESKAFQNYCELNGFTGEYSKTYADVVGWYLFSYPEYDDFTKKCLDYCKDVYIKKNKFSIETDLASRWLPRKVMISDKANLKVEPIEFVSCKIGDKEIKEYKEVINAPAFSDVTIFFKNNLLDKSATNSVPKKLIYYVGGSTKENVVANMQNLGGEQYALKIQLGKPGKYNFQIVDEKADLLVGYYVVNVIE